MDHSEEQGISHNHNLKHLCSNFPLFTTCHPFFVQDSERNLLSEAKVKFEDVTFDIQGFISENTQFLSPAQSSHLLKSLSSAQRAFREQAEMLDSQRSALDVLLDTREREDQEKVCLWSTHATVHLLKQLWFICVVKTMLSACSRDKMKLTGHVFLKHMQNVMMACSNA